jgi:LacI family transcriptional regulator
VSALQKSSLRDIARAAGVSVMSVSRALRNQPGLSENTRQKILLTAKRHEYKPNPFVSTLMAHVRRQKPVGYHATLAYVVPSVPDFEAAFGYQKFFAGATKRAASLGYRTELFGFAEANSNPRRLSDILRARGIRGVLLGAFPSYSSPVFQMDWDRFCSATIGYASIDPPLHRASTDHFRAMQLAFEKLRAAGYERIGFYTLNVVDDWTHHQWTSAYLYYQKQQPAENSVPVLLTEARDQKLFARWFERHQPDAVITKHIEVLDWMKALGARPPKVAFVHLDWISEFGNVAGVNQNSEVVGAAAVDLVIEQFHWNEGGVPSHPKAVLAQNQWVPGATVRVAQPAPAIA